MPDPHSTESARAPVSVVRRWRLAIIGLVIVLVIFGIGAIRESYRGWKVDQEIRTLDAQADELEGRNQRLRELADALQSPERIDLEARARLGMQKPGEHVVVLDGFSASGTWESDMKLDVIADRPDVELSNPQKWLKYFVHGG